MKVKGWAIFWQGIKKMKKDRIFIITFLFIISLFCVPCFAIEEFNLQEDFFKAPKIIKGNVLTVKDCVALSFQNNPKIKRKKYELDIAKSDVGLAKSKYFPTLALGAGFNYERNSDSVYYDKKYRDLPYVALSLNQLIYDFGKTFANIKQHEFLKIVAEYEFMDELCHSLFNVKAKYYNVLQKKALLEIAKKDVDINQEIINSSNSEVDLLTAKINLSKAQIKLFEAQKELQNAKYDLNNAMYIDNQPDYNIENTETFDFNIEKNESFNFAPINFPFKNDEASEIAYKNSPDLAVIINTKNAMEQSVKYVQKSYLPDLSADVGYGLNNTYDTTNNSLKVSVGLSSNVNLKELKHNIDIAKAQLNILDNEIILFKKDLYFEVQRALNNVAKTKEQVLISQKETAQAYKIFNLVFEKYKTKNLNYTELQNARKDYVKSKEHYASNLYDYNMALIQTEMAMHYHIVDIHHKSEHAMHSHSDELLEHLNEALDCLQNETKNKRKH